MAEARVLKILLEDIPVGHVTGFQDGRNLFTFDESYIDLGPSRPTLSLSFNTPGDEEATEQRLRAIHSSRMKLPPFFSNLLPEGPLREYMVKRLKVHQDHEFDILLALSTNLPGAIRAIPADELPQATVNHRPDTTYTPLEDAEIKFSLGGSQLKFSMIERGGRFMLDDGEDVWIIKPPHPNHPDVPKNEFTMMRMADAVGINTPEVKLVNLGDIELVGLEGFAIPQNEKLAYAIKRYDRTPDGRIHVEDFAQVFGVYADQEYKATNYDTIGRLIFDLFPNRFEQLAEFIRRLVVNILIGNGDAHLKNWSVIYTDRITPQLSPTYDLVSSIQYIQNDTAALNLGGEKRFEKLGVMHFDRLARHMNAPSKFVLDVVNETVKSAQEKWPELISELELPKSMQDRLYRHWNSLSELLRIRA